MKGVLITLSILLTVSTIFAQRKSNIVTSTDKNTYFVYWGYNRSGYTQSDLRFVGTGYDFTMANVTASDHPERFSAENYFSIDKITIPQFNLRIGYYFKKNWALTIGYDHLKYIFDNGNNVQLSGHVDPGVDTVTNLSGDYNGQEFVTNRNTFHYENSNGLNYIRAELMRSQELLSFGRKRQFVVTGNLGLSSGAILSINDFNFAGQFDRYTASISGYGLSLHSGLRLEFFRHLFLQGNLNGGFIHQLHVKTRPNDPYAFARQKFGYYEYNVVVGWLFHIKGKKDCDCPHW